MKPAQYLLDNVKWTFSRTDYSVVTRPVTAKQLFDDLQQFCQNASPNGAAAPNCNFVQFALDQVFLSNPTNQATRHLKGLYFHYANKLAHAKRVLSCCQRLPAMDGKIVLHTLAHNFVVATQGSKQSSLWQDYCKQAMQYLKLHASDKAILDAFYSLCLCQYYATLYKTCKKQGNLLQICNLTSNFDLLYHKWVDNNCYSRNFYKTSRLFSALDCFCNSATLFDGKRTDVVFNLRCNVNKRNCFDTFTQYKYGKVSANFRFLGNVLEALGHYHCYDNTEVRSYLFKNKGKKSATFQLVFRMDINSSATHFVHEEACCFAKDNMYVGIVCLVDDRPICLSPTLSQQPASLKSRFSLDLPLQPKQAANVKLVVVYASSLTELAEVINSCTQIGATNCFAYSDSFTYGEVSKVATNLTIGASNLYENTPTSPVKCAKFCYQLGNEQVATLVDSNGNNATLIDGFVSSGGEGIYAVANGKITKLNCGDVVVQGDDLVYISPAGEVTLCHSVNAKAYKITLPKPSNVLYLLPLEEQSRVEVGTGSLNITSSSRSFSITYDNTVQCLTTNALECNPGRLRTRLSGNVAMGNTIALYFHKTTALKIEISNNKSPIVDFPVVSGHKTSSQLTLVNSKTIFQLSNGLALPTVLSLASIAYTHPRWLKNYLNCALTAQCEFAYYAQNGKRGYHQNHAVVYFGALWLALVANDAQLLSKLLPTTTALLEGSLPLVYKALLVKKLAQLGIDKVSNLVLCAQYGKTLAKDKAAFSLAQVVGAIPLAYPSQQRIADLCQQHNLPPAWQFVATYESLYNLSLCCGKVSAKPVPSTKGFVATDFAVRQHQATWQLQFVPAKVHSVCCTPLDCKQADGSPSKTVKAFKLTVKY